MSDSEFAQIASFALESEAGQFRSILEEHGIPAFIDGATSNTMLSHVGTALGGVKLFVRVADVARATEVFRSLNNESDGANAEWFCGDCEQEIDPGFQVCWSCGKDRTKVEQPFPSVQQQKDREDQSADTISETDKVLQRAWRTSVIGFCLFPIITHLYSMYLLIIASSSDTPFSQRSQKLFYMTFALNIIASCIWGTLLQAMLRN